MNEVDKFTGFIPDGSYVMKGFNRFDKHVTVKRGYCLDQHGVWLTCSGREVAEFNSLEALNMRKVPLLAGNLAKSKGLIVTAETLLGMEVACIDCKIDVPVSDKPAMLSFLRELAYQNTSKTEVISYYNQLGFENSILIKPSCKTVKDSLLVYDKVDEIIANKRDDEDYYNNFSRKFLNDNAHLLRFERRLQKSKWVKKAFHLEEKHGMATLKEILESPYNVVGEKVLEVFKLKERNMYEG